MDMNILLEIDDISDVKLKCPLRYSYLSSYTYLLLEENLIALNLIFHKQEFLDTLERSLINNIISKKFKIHL